MNESSAVSEDGPPHPASYASALAELGRALTFGIHPSLDGIRALAEALGRPQDSFASIQVTGTNGKTSVTRLVEAILVGEGVVAGAYTSPHLVSYTERIEIDGVRVSEDEFGRAVLAAVEAARQVKRTGARTLAAEITEFELLTAAALWLFRERHVDFAALEVGLGGRWDATSVVLPAVSVITGVGLDHTDRLGPTIDDIAADKAQILTRASAAVLGPGTAPVADIFLEQARHAGLEPWFVAEGTQLSPVAEDHTARFRVAERPSSPGGWLAAGVAGMYAAYPGLRVAAPSYQAPNVAVAVVAAEAALGRALDLEALRRSLAAMTFPGRFEVVRREPPLVLDGAHNPQAAAVLASAIDEAFPDAAPVAVIGILADKDAEEIVRALAGHVSGFIATEASSPRALPAADLASLICSVTGVRPAAFSRLAGALAAGAQSAAGAIVTGSLYTAGEARGLLLPGG